MKVFMLAAIFLLTAYCIPCSANQDADKYIEVVRQYADNVLEHCRDRHGDVHSPLFVDGLNVDTKEGVVWRFNENEWVISNQANHQNLFRTLVGLTNMTGDDKYKGAAKEAIAYMFENHRASCGLLYWGGHQFIDLKTMNNIGEFDANCHEFKWNFPYYEFMWEVDPEATEQFIKAKWNAHIMDWDRLEMNRHGPFGMEVGEDIWADRDFEFPEPFYKGRALSFINTGSDMIYAAYRLYQLAGDEGAKTWGRRLMKMYVNARDPETKLGVYQYSQLESGDRGQLQFGPEFGEKALEGTYLPSDRGIYSRHALSVLLLAEGLGGDDGKELAEWMREGMAAYVKHAYMPETNQIRPIWADGTDLTGFETQRSGYFGNKGIVLQPRSASSFMLLSYSLGYRLTEDETLWEMARGIAKGNGLGDIGDKPGENVEVNLETTNSSATVLFALADLYWAVKHPDYLKLACKVGDNIIDQYFHNGFFLPSENHINASMDATQPLALLTLAAMIQDKPGVVPQYNGGRGFIHGRYDGRRTTDSAAIYSRTRSSE